MCNKIIVSFSEDSSLAVNNAMTIYRMMNLEGIPSILVPEISAKLINEARGNGKNIILYTSDELMKTDRIEEVCGISVYTVDL